MSTITPFLWFDQEAEQAMDLYVSIFEDARVISVTRLPGDGPILTAQFVLAGQEFIALNGGPGHPFNDSISFVIHVETQAEIDRLWGRLTADGGEPGPCGWLKDRFGLSWQVVPPILGELLGDADPEKAGRTMQAMLQMSKLDIAALLAAHDGA